LTFPTACWVYVDRRTTIPNWSSREWYRLWLEEYVHLSSSVSVDCSTWFRPGNVISTRKLHHYTANWYHTSTETRIPTQKIVSPNYQWTAWIYQIIPNPCWLANETFVALRSWLALWKQSHLIPIQKGKASRALIRYGEQLLRQWK
jgi:hypothetical protein